VASSQLCRSHYFLFYFDNFPRFLCSKFVLGCYLRYVWKGQPEGGSDRGFHSIIAAEKYWVRKEGCLSNPKEVKEEVEEEKEEDKEERFG